uniref:WAP domain-containing protein n=1 Tax=Anisakis simplex TaxID=6269 RepID=A0A0M3KHI1_ANISI
LSTVVKPGECPRLMGGLCVMQCTSDAQCSGALKCCSNGCGYECTIATYSLPLLNNLPILPITSTRSRAKLGSKTPEGYGEDGGPDNPVGLGGPRG